MKILLIADDAVFHLHFCFVVFSSVLSLNLGRQSLITKMVREDKTTWKANYFLKIVVS